MKYLAILFAVLLTGCATSVKNGQPVVGIDLMSISSYKASAWVPRTPVLRQICAAGDYYVYAWKNTPWQTAAAHLAAIYVSDKETWDDRVQGWIDEIRGKEDAPAPVTASDLTEAEVQLLSSGAGNTINLNYTYIPGATRPDVVVQNNGNDNTFNVTIGPIEEEE